MNLGVQVAGRDIGIDRLLHSLRSSVLKQPSMALTRPPHFLYRVCSTKDERIIILWPCVIVSCLSMLSFESV